jgi:hypothetical protein
MASEVRICPHCGASVSGDTDQCPRCDGWLASPPVPENSGDEPQDNDHSPEQPSDLAATEDDEVYEVRLLHATSSNTGDTPPPHPPDEGASQVESEPDKDAHAETGATDETYVSDSSADGEDFVVASIEVLPPEAFDTPAMDQPSAEITAAAPLDEPTPPGTRREQEASPARPHDESAISAFENAQTAPLPSDASTLRPAHVVPAPQPLPVQDTQPKLVPALPPAPFTPPPPPLMPGYAMPMPAQVVAPAPGQALQQRAQAYALGGYHLLEQKPNEIVMSYGKPLSYFWWIVGCMTGIGILWYFLILLFSGFRRDKVFIILEPDGTLYEDGPGAAHLRRRRSKLARRWGVIGILLVIICVFAFALMILASSVLLNEYEAELSEAYPELGLFQSDVDPDTLDETEVQNTRVAVLAIFLMLGLSSVGFVGGLLMSIASYVQSATYRVDVIALPNLR